MIITIFNKCLVSIKNRNYNEFSQIINVLELDIINRNYSYSDYDFLIIAEYLEDLDDNKFVYKFIHLIYIIIKHLINISDDDIVYTYTNKVFELFEFYLFNINSLFAFKLFINIIGKSKRIKYIIQSEKICNYSILAFMSFNECFLEKIKYILKLDCHNICFSIIENLEFHFIENTHTFHNLNLSNYFLKIIKKKEIELIKLFIDYEIIEVNNDFLDNCSFKKNKSFICYLMDKCDEVNISRLFMQLCKIKNYPMINYILKKDMLNNINRFELAILKETIIYNICSTKYNSSRITYINNWIYTISNIFSYNNQNLIYIDNNLLLALFNNPDTIFIFHDILRFNIKLQINTSDLLKYLSNRKITKILNVIYKSKYKFSYNYELCRNSLISLFNRTKINIDIVEYIINYDINVLIDNCIRFDNLKEKCKHSKLFSSALYSYLTNYSNYYFY